MSNLTPPGDKLKSRLVSIAKEKTRLTPASYVAVVKDLEAASPGTNQEHITRFLRELYYTNFLLNGFPEAWGVNVPDTKTVVSTEVQGLSGDFVSAGFTRGGTNAEIAGVDVGHALVGRDLLNQKMVFKAFLYTQGGDIAQAGVAYVVESWRWSADVTRNIASGEFRKAGKEYVQMYSRPAKAAYGSATIEQQKGNLMGARLRGDIPLSHALSLYWNLDW